MSNEAKRNPRSTQFIDPNPPKFVIGCGLDARAVPNRKWIEANQVADGETPTEAFCSEEDMDVEVFLVGMLCEPSALVPREKWPQGGAPLPRGAILRIPFVEFMKTIKESPINAGVQWRAPMVVVPPGERKDLDS